MGVFLFVLFVSGSFFSVLRATHCTPSHAMFLFGD